MNPEIRVRAAWDRFDQGRLMTEWNKVWRVKKIINRHRMYIIVNGIWALPALFLMVLIRALLDIKFKSFRSDRIGHFAADVGAAISQRIIFGDARSIYLNYFDCYPTCNRYWETLTSRHFFIFQPVRYLAYWNRLFGRPIPEIPSSVTGSRDIHGMLERSPPNFRFLQEELLAGQQWLQQQGWQPGEPFVCLMVRDDAFLDSPGPQGKKDWSYHNYRNSEIATYVKTCNWLAERGVWVFRMGKKMKTRLPFQHKRVVDYAFRADRSDFLDVFLFSRCDLCITTGTGPDLISDVFRRPILAVNFLPLHGLWSWSDFIAYPKILRRKKTGDLLTLSEYLDSTYFHSDEYAKNDVQVEDLDEDMILLGVQEAWGRVERNWVDRPDEIENRAASWKIIRDHHLFSKYHKYVHPSATVGAGFLSFATAQNKRFLRLH